MAEYISRETMIKLLQSMADNAEANGFSYDREVIESVMATLAGIPTADVAKVVRCKDCTNHGHCVVEDGFVLAKHNDDRRFCGAGERKEQNNG